MKLNNLIKTAIIATSLALPVAMSQAAEPGPYIGMGFGESDDQILAETATGFKFFAGANFSRHIGFELSYVDLGSFANDQLHQDGVAYEIIGYIPLDDSLSLFVRGGFFDWEVTDGFFSNTGTEPTAGIGMHVQISRDLSLRAEYQNFFDVDGGDISLISASLSLHF